MNPYTYVENNPLKYLDPYGYAPQWLQNTWSAVKKGTKAAADFLAIDDIKTLTSSQSSTIDKVIAGASLIPAGKIIKGGKLVVKLAKAGDKASDASKATKAVAKACNCFTAGTKVKTDQGDKNIEDVQISDRVLSQDENTGEEAYKTVTATFNHETDEIYRIHVGGQVIEATYNHPFWVVDKGWVFVKDLKPGDLLEQSDGKTLEVGSIEIQQRQATVDNMTVDGFHTYFVSGLGIWVHNTNTKNCLEYQETRVEWNIKAGASDKRTYHFAGVQHTAYQDPKTGLYWVRVRPEEAHGGKVFQVYKRMKKDLIWQKDADEFGDYTKDKHKGEKGQIIKNVF